LGSLDKAGFKVDEDVFRYIKGNTKSKLNRSILVTPDVLDWYCDYTDRSDNFIHWKSIAKLKWNAEDICLEDEEFRRTWISIVSSTIVGAVKRGIPVRLSMTMYEKLFVYLADSYLFVVFLYPNTNDALKFTKERERAFIEEEFIESIENDKRLMRSFECHFILARFNEMQGGICGTDIKLTKAFKALIVHGSVAMSNYCYYPNMLQDSYNWSNDKFINDYIRDKAMAYAAGSFFNRHNTSISFPYRPIDPSSFHFDYQDIKSQIFSKIDESSE
jgi:hypothetical protein